MSKEIAEVIHRAFLGHGYTVTDRVIEAIVGCGDKLAAAHRSGLDAIAKAHRSGLDQIAKAISESR